MPLYTSEVSVDNTPLPVSVSNATLAVTQSGSWTVSLTTESIEIGKVDQGTPGTLANAWPVELSDGTNLLGVAAHPVRTDPTGTTTQPVSGTITANQGTSPWVVSLTSTTITGTVAVTQSTSPWVVSGTVTANIGTTNGLALDASVTGLQVSQGSTTSGQKGGLTLGAVTTAAPTYTTAQTSPLSLTTAGALRTDSSGTTQPVSGTVTANAGTGNFNENLAQVNGSTVVTAATGIQKVGISDSSGSSITNGQKTMANSVPVVIASDQSAVPVNVAGGSVSSATVTANSVGAGAAVTLLASRAARVRAVIFNEAGTLFVKAGSTASSSDYTWRLTANTELDVTDYTGILTAIKSAGTTNVQATDF